jgi:cyclase
VSLAARVIPTLLMKGDRLVKGRQFSADRVVGVVEQAVRVHQRRGVDELILLDVAATPEGRGPDFEAIARLTECCFAPITVGGGVRSVEDARKLLAAGADKVAVNTALHVVPDLLLDCSEYFGSQCMVMAIDVLGSNTTMTHCGRHGYSHSPEYVADWAQRKGAGEILLTSIDREGTMQGYDLTLVEAVAKAVDIPVIANGGCSGPEDMLAAIRVGASAVAAGALFQFTEHTPRSCAEYLATNGVEARVTA